MSRGQYAGKRVRLISRRKRSEKGQRKISKSIVLLVALISIISVATGSTLAFLVTRTDSVKNTFNYSNVACAVEEVFEDGVKKDVRIENTGDIDAYIRTVVIVTWKDSAGNVYAMEPRKGEDYEITINDSDWFEKGGFYYYTKPVSPGKTTGILIDECKPKCDGPEGYDLSVEILASAIQSKPEKAVKNSWHVTVTSDGTIKM